MVSFCFFFIQIKRKLLLKCDVEFVYTCIYYRNGHFDISIVMILVCGGCSNQTQKKANIHTGLRTIVIENTIMSFEDGTSKKRARKGSVLERQMIMMIEVVMRFYHNTMDAKTILREYQHIFTKFIMLA